MSDDRVLAPPAPAIVALARALQPKPSLGQRCVYRLLDGLPPRGPTMAEVYRTLLGREWGPDLARRFPTVALKAGRGASKSTIASRFALQRANAVPVHDLAPGEVGYVLLVAPKRERARDLMRYVQGAVRSTELLREDLATSPTADDVVFRRGACIRVATADAGGLGVRSVSILSAVFDEANLFRDRATGVVNDSDIYEAAQPRVRPGGQILLVSSPWVETGLFHRLYEEHWGKSRGDVLFLDCPHPSLLNPAWVAPAGMVEGSTAERREVRGEWVSDDEAGICSRAAVVACQRANNGEGPDLPPAAGERYADACDAHGAGSHRTGYAVGHWDRHGRLVVDLVRGWTSAQTVEQRVVEMARLRARYGIGTPCAADQYAFDVLAALGRSGVYDRAGQRWTMLFRHDRGDRAAQAIRFGEAVEAGTVSLPQSERLRQDLPRVATRPTPGGHVGLRVPIDSAGGHCDESTAVILLHATAVDRRAAGVVRPPGYDAGRDVVPIVAEEPVTWGSRGFAALSPVAPPHEGE